MTKLSKAAGEEIWQNFNKFAVYDDLRDLYQRTIPAIKQFEDKIKAFKDEIAQFQLVILNFDQNILEKTNKEVFDAFKKDAYESFLRKEEVTEFKESVRAE